MLAGLQTVPPAAGTLGAAGLIPFVAGTAGVFVIGGEGARFVLFALAAYAATILAFMGGIHWGAAMAAGRPDWRPLGLSTVFSLIGWLALLIDPRMGLILMAIAFAALLRLDMAEVGQGRLPEWYPAMRGPLTMIVVVCLVIASFAPAGVATP